VADNLADLKTENLDIIVGEKQKHSFLVLENEPKYNENRNTKRKRESQIIEVSDSNISQARVKLSASSKSKTGKNARFISTIRGVVSLPTYEGVSGFLSTKSKRATPKRTIHCIQHPVNPLTMSHTARSIRSKKRKG